MNRTTKRRSASRLVPRRPAAPASLRGPNRHALLFEVLEQRIVLATISWNVDTSGYWDVAANWVDDLGVHRVPGPADDVIIDRPSASPTVTFRTDSATVHSITGADPLALTGGPLTVTTTLADSAGVSLAGGVLKGADVLKGTTVSGYGTLDGVTLDGNLTVTGSTNYLTSAVTISDGLVLNGTISISGADSSNRGYLRFSGTQSLTGSGSIVTTGGYGGTGLQTDPNGADPGTLTVGPSMTISGKYVVVSGNLINQGSILADGANGNLTLNNLKENDGTVRSSNGASLYINSTSLVNRGAIAITGGSYLLLEATSWTNVGTITAIDSRVELVGSYTTASLAGLSVSGGELDLAGTLDNSGSSLDLGRLGPIMLYGTIHGGTILPASSAPITGVSSQYSIPSLDGVTIHGGTLTLPTGTIGVTGGLTLDNAAVTLGAADGSTTVALLFEGAADQTLGGTGTITFGGHNSSNTNELEVDDSSGPNLTIGAGVGIHGGTGIISSYASGGHILNLGTIAADGGGFIHVFNLLENRGTLRASGTGSLFVDGTNWVNRGTVSATGGASLTLGDYPEAWSNASGGTITTDGSTLNLEGIQTNAGSITAATSTVNLYGSYATASLMGLSVSGGELDLYGTLENSGATLTLDRRLGTAHLHGTIRGGTIAEADGATLAIAAPPFLGYGVSPPVATLDGVIVHGDLDLTAQNAELDILDGLELDGTATIGATNGSYGALVFIDPKPQALTGHGTVILARSPNGQSQIETSSVGNTAPGPWTIGPGITLEGVGGFVGSESGLVNQGAIVATGGGAFNLYASASTTVANTGSITASGQTTIQLQGSVTLDDPNFLALGPATTLYLSGDLTGTTRNATSFAVTGTVVLDGTGTSTAPQRLEAMSRDLGAVPAGYLGNFAYGSIHLGGADYVRIADDARNSGGSGPEAVYTDALVVPAGSTLDLNGHHLYARAVQIDGTVVGGSVTQIPGGGPLILDTPTSGEIVAVGNSDDWTFFGRSGQTVGVVANTGSGLPNPPLPALGFAALQLIAPDGTVLASGSNAVSGDLVALAGVSLPADGTYHVRVSASTGQPRATGSYGLAVYNETIRTVPVELNRNSFGHLNNPYAVDHWTFSAVAGQQIRFDLLAASNTGIQFDLVGPDSKALFANQATTSDLITLLASGTYTLVARGTGGQAGDYAFRIEQTSQADLTANQPYQGVLAGSAQAQLFRVTLPGIEQLLVTLADSSPADRNEVYVQYGSPPTRSDYQFRSDGTPGAAAKVLVPSAAPGDWYILVYGDTVPVTSGYTLLASTSGVFLFNTTPDHHGDGADAVLTLTGAGFTATTSVSLVAPDGHSYAIARVEHDSPTQMTATVPAGSVPPGTYTLKVTQADGSSAQLPGAFRIISGGVAHLTTQIIAPQYVARSGYSTVYVDVTNTGDLAMPAPLLIVNATQDGQQGALLTLDQSRVVQGVWSSAYPDGFAPSVQILGSGETPGVLQPGESLRFPVYYAGWSNGSVDPGKPITFSLSVLQGDDTTRVDWASLESGLRPSGIDPTSWDAVYANLTTQFGPTYGSYVTRLDADAAYLGTLGETVTDVGTLFGFEVQQADGLGPITHLGDAVDASVAAPGLSLSFGRSFAPSITARNVLGPLGLGWSDSWQISLAVGADGTVVITGPGGSQRRFQPDRRSGYGYFDQPGDYARLAALGGGLYTLTEQDGQVTAFNSDGTLHYVQDTNGNRITAGYTGGLLTTLTHSSGQVLKIAYNAAGRIMSVTDPVGRATTYAYDASNRHLISATTYNGLKTTYTYDTGSNPSVVNAMRSIAAPDGTHSYYTYDAFGRIVGTSLDGGALPVTIAYGPGGTIAISDSSGTTTDSFDADGHLVKVVDPLGRAVHYDYDANNNLVSVTDPAGQVSTTTYDGSGNVIRTTDPLGHATTYAYAGPFDRLASVTDARGNAIDYGYDARGNLISTTYADGSVERAAYDSVGDILQTINRRGQPIASTSDSSGRILTETFPDGSVTTYGYDTRGNLVTATDATGTIVLKYDASDRLVQVTYPDGQFLKYSYDAVGRRTQMIDQDGFATNYAYDALGRLSTLTDSSGNLVDRYTYDTAGRLAREDKGNGTATTYAYDAAGQLLHLVNLAPGGSVDSRFDYTYDVLGHVATMTTGSVVTSYGYDPTGQLVSIEDTARHSIGYVYDAVGNRISEDDNGVLTLYSVNALDEYTSASNSGDSAAYDYDLDGNEIARTSTDGSSVFTYDILGRRSGMTSPDGSTTLRYDALGDLASLTVDGNTTRYLHDPTNLGVVVAESDASGSIVARDIFGSGLVSRVIGTAGATFFDYDRIGSTIAVTDRSGKIQSQASYLPFGQASPSAANLSEPFAFLGRYGSISSGSVVVTGVRDYDPTLGRFQEVDPSGLFGGMNPYTYAQNTPTAFVDVNGLFPTAPLLSPKPFGTPPPGAPPAPIGPLPETPAIPNLPAYIPDPRGPFRMPPTRRYLPVEPPAVPPAEEALASVEATESAEVGFVTGETSVGEALAVGGASSAGVGLLIEAVPVSSYLLTRAAIEHNFLRFGDVYNSKPFTDAANSVAKAILSVAHSAESFLAPILRYVGIRISIDPNGLVGPTGFGPTALVSVGDPFSYQVDFENEATATAPAQRVTVTNQLDPNLDWGTFQLTGIGFGDTVLSIQVGSQHYQTTVTMTENGQTFQVQVEAGLDATTGEVYATFQSIDPNTDLPPDVLTGFLPPEDGTGRGKGYLSYIVSPKTGLATGTQVRNVAVITFDANDPIATDQVDPHDPTKGIDPAKQALNTIDAGAPASTVAPLPATTRKSNFTVSWSGTDDAGGSGIAYYDVYAAEDGGAFILFLSHTTATSITFDGRDGHSYAFSSVATDNVGNVQATPSAAQASTTVAIPGTTTTVTSSETPANPGDSITFTATVAASTGSNTPTGSVQFLIDGTALGAPVALVRGMATSAPIASLAVGNHVVTASFVDVLGNFAGSTGTLVGGETIRSAPTGTGTATATTTTLGSSSASPTYGQALTFTATVAPTGGSGVPTGSVQFVLDGVNFGPAVALVNGVATSPSIATLGAGSHTVVALYSGDPGDRASTSANFTEAVAPAPLVVTALDATRQAGQANPAFAASFRGFVLGQDASTLGGSLTFATSATSGSPAGNYAITPGGLTAANYAIRYVAGTLSVTAPAVTAPPSPLGSIVTVTPSSANPTYGQSLVLVAHVAAASGRATPGGTVQFVIDGVPYGSPVALVGGSAASPAIASLGAGSHLIGASYSGDASFAGAAAPAISLGVARAPLVIVANDATKVYGQANPGFTASYGGFVLGQDASILGGSLVVTTAATAASHVGRYPLTPSGLTSANYAITDVSGTLAVTPAPLIVSAVGVTKPYGQPVPALTPTYSGFVNGDGPSSLTTPATFTTTATAGSTTGSYPIIAGGAASPDYAITYNNSVLIVPPSVTTSRPGAIAFVTQLYRAILGRTPDAPGLDYWLERLTDGATPAAVDRAFYESTEYRTLKAEHLAPKANPKISLAAANRADELASVPPAALADPGRIALVSTLYREILGRALDASGRNDWLAELVVGTTPARVARDIFDSPEHRSLQRRHKAPRISERSALAHALKAEKAAVRIRSVHPAGPMSRHR